MTTRSWRSVKEARLSPEAARRASKRAKEAAQEVTLRELRTSLEMTQADVAKAAAMTQSELSRIESRDDHLVSSLRRYVEALGGEIEIAAVIGGKRIKLTDV